MKLSTNQVSVHSEFFCWFCWLSFFGQYILIWCQLFNLVLFLCRFKELWSHWLHSQSGRTRESLTEDRGQLRDFLTLVTSSHITTNMSLPSSSPEREDSVGAFSHLDCSCSPPGMDADPSSTGSPVLSPDSSSHDAVLSAPAASPADSENLSPDELELLAKLEEQNRWDKGLPDG